jgi:hypothetical protein
MARFSAAWRTTGAGSTTLPIAGLMAVATVRPRLVEVGVFNSTATACAVALRRVTAAGTSGRHSPSCTRATRRRPRSPPRRTRGRSHRRSSTGNLRTASLGAAIGSGVIWTFGGALGGLVIPNTTGDGVVISVLTGTGQICDVSLTWDE